MTDLTQTMHNGASVKDWLGTAATAARVAALYIEDIRDGNPDLNVYDKAEEQLLQALDELRTVRENVEAGPE